MGALGEWGMAALGASAVLLSGYFSVRAIRRDRAEDQFTKLAEKVQGHAERIGRLEEFRDWVGRTFKL